MRKNPKWQPVAEIIILFLLNVIVGYCLLSIGVSFWMRILFIIAIDFLFSLFLMLPFLTWFKTSILKTKPMPYEKTIETLLERKLELLENYGKCQDSIMMYRKWIGEKEKEMEKLNESVAEIDSTINQLESLPA